MSVTVVTKCLLNGSKCAQEKTEIEKQDKTGKHASQLW
jgi:hypothetical protein